MSIVQLRTKMCDTAESAAERGVEGEHCTHIQNGFGAWHRSHSIEPNLCRCSGFEVSCAAEKQQKSTATHYQNRFG